MAIALAAAGVCAGLPDLDGTVHFVFQPAEENEGGGRRMVEEGLFKLFPCDNIYALHNWPELPVGTCVARDGPMMAAFGSFEISVIGSGSHGAMPHVGTDAIVTTAQIVSALQSIVSRNVDPLLSAVISVTQVRGGDTWNVLPDECVIRGATRWYEDEIGESIQERIAMLTNSIAVGFGCAARVQYERRHPATVNDPASAKLLRDVASEIRLNVINSRPSMAAEDFAYMLQAVPGCYLWLGAGRQDDNPGLHSARFDFNDDVLRAGVELWVSLVRRCLVRP
jgi:hippurate hydrolase